MQTNKTKELFELVSTLKLKQKSIASYLRVHPVSLNRWFSMFRKSYKNNIIVPPMESPKDPISKYSERFEELKRMTLVIEQEVSSNLTLSEAEKVREVSKRVSLEIESNIIPMEKRIKEVTVVCPHCRANVATTSNERYACGNCFKIFEVVMGIPYKIAFKLAS